MTEDSLDRFDALFSGVIGQEYQMLKRICPLATEMSRLVGATVGQYPSRSGQKLNIVELGGGTGITTLAILTSGQELCVTSIDNEPTMQNQAKTKLRDWANKNRLQFCGQDALTALKDLEPNGVDIVASAYTLHNFASNYRAEVIDEIFRVLKPGGQFINGDRYALDDATEQTRMVQQEISDYFKILVRENKLDLLEHWIIHLFNDESEHHVMRESKSMRQLQDAGFTKIALSHRMAVNALVTASKPIRHN